MSYFLDDRIALKVSQGLPFLFNRTSQVEHLLTLGEAVAVSCLNALGEIAPATGLCEDLVGAEGPKWIHRVVDRYWTWWGGEKAQSIDFSWLDQLDTTKLLQPTARMVAYAPEKVIWMVTLGCNRRCPYCFFETLPGPFTSENYPLDTSFSRQRIMAMLQEMHDIGTSHLILTGGEPLLRPDIPDILLEAKKWRIRTHLYTRQFIPLSLAKSLAAAEPATLVYSFDSAEKRLADGLAGSKGFREQAVASLKNLLAAGIHPEVNAVITRLNYEYLDELAALLVDLGVPTLSISSLVQSYPPKRSITRLLPDLPLPMLHQKLETLQERWAGQLNIKAENFDKNTQTQHHPRHPVCAVGYTDLHLLPDGRATRCRYLPKEEKLIIGSLEKQSIMDIWQGRALDNFTHPTPEYYENTRCFQCSAFETCNDRGRCYASSRQAYGQLYAPDAFCQMI